MEQSLKNLRSRVATRDDFTKVMLCVEDISQVYNSGAKSQRIAALFFRGLTLTIEIFHHAITSPAQDSERISREIMEREVMSDRYNPSDLMMMSVTQITLISKLQDYEPGIAYEALLFFQAAAIEATTKANSHQ